MNMEMGYAYRMHSDMTVKAIWDHWRTLSLLIAAFLVMMGRRFSRLRRGDSRAK
jgi:type II secretory pathway component PulL